MTETELNTMLQCLKPRVYQYKKGENITIEGEHFTGIGVMLSGSASITKENASGGRVIMAVAQPSDMFGEIAAFSKHKVWPATVVAQEECKVMFLPPELIIGNCEKMCVSHKTLINNMLEIVSSRALMLNKKVKYLTIKSLRARVCSLFLEQYNASGSTTFMMPMNRNELADFLNVSRPSLSREMAKMKGEGIIDFYKASIQIQNLDTLKAMAE
jgi:CRP-like cAMP-binding protein